MFLNHINKTLLPGKLKLLISAQVRKLKLLISTQWLGIPQWLSGKWNYPLQVWSNNSHILKLGWLWPLLTLKILLFEQQPLGWQQGESGIQLNPTTPCMMQSQLSISGLWLVKSSMGELALGSSQKLINGTRQHQGRRDSSWWKRWGGRATC